MIVKCNRCHHEAQATNAPRPCDWCGGMMEHLANDYIEDGPSLAEIAAPRGRESVMPDFPDCVGHTPGPWEMWTSNSFRRIGHSGRFLAGVCEPVTQVSDGHPDLYFRNGGFDGPDARLLVAAVQTPHRCADPDCPGRRNAEQLALLPELVNALEVVAELPDYTWAQQPYLDALALARDAVDRARKAGIS